MNNKSVFMVSLNSKRLEAYLDSKNDSINNIAEKLEVFVYDIFEVLNGLFFSNNNIRQQSAEMESIIQRVNEEFVAKSTKSNVLIKFSEIQKEIAPYLIAVYTEYFSNQSFKRHCKSQIFQNLQPKLREVEITNHKSSLTEILSPFLLAEIAYYLFIFNNSGYKCVYGLESEMEIIKAIKEKKYTRFNEFLNYPIPHYKVEI